MIYVFCERCAADQQHSPRSIKKWHFLRFALAFPTFRRKSQRAKLPSIHSLFLSVCVRWIDESRCMQWEMWRKNEDQIKSWKKCEQRALTAWRSGNKQQQLRSAWTQNANARVYKLGSCLCPREFYVFSISRQIFGGVDDERVFWARARLHRKTVNHHANATHLDKKRNQEKCTKFDHWFLLWNSDVFRSHYCCFYPKCQHTMPFSKWEIARFQGVCGKISLGSRETIEDTQKDDGKFSVAQNLR